MNANRSSRNDELSAARIVYLACVSAAEGQLLAVAR